MGLNKGNVGEVVVTREPKLYTGVASMRVFAINPTREELEKFDIRFQDEINYTGEKMDEATNSQVKTVRVDVWMANQQLDIKTKAAFFLEDRIQKNKDGDKQEWINNIGRSAWGSVTEPPTEYQWFDSSTARPAKVGEAVLINFLINWMNTKPTDEVFIEDWEALFKGDASEISSLVPIYGEKNVVKALLHVVENEESGKYYQNVYTRFFARWNHDKLTSWSDFVHKEDKEGKQRNLPRGFYSFEIKEFKPIPEVPDSDPTPEESEGTVAKTTKFF